MFSLVSPRLPAGVVHYYFQGPLGKTAPAHELAVESAQVGLCQGLRGPPHVAQRAVTLLG